MTRPTTISACTRWRTRAGGRIPFGDFALTAGLLFGCKVGEHRHVVENDNENLGVSTFPFRLRDWWDCDSEASDVTRIALNLALRYNLERVLHVPLSVEAGCNWLHAFGVQLLSCSNRQTTTLKLVYNY